MTAFSSLDYPLNCIDDTGDGFSGWFAISNTRQCNDFCYWQLPSQNISYAAWNTANPHESTVIKTPFGIAYWTCAYDSADDRTLKSAAEEHRWVDSWRDFYLPPMDSPNLGDASDVPFPYLKCQKGAGELLKTLSGDVVKLAVFWESLILLALLIFIGELVALYFFWRRRGRSTRYNHIISSENGGVFVDESDFDASQEISFQIDKNGDDNEEDISVPIIYLFPQSTTSASLTSKGLAPRCKYCAPLALKRSLWTLRVLLVILLNGLLAVILSFVTISLIEIKARPHYSERLQKLTPACSDPAAVCVAGNRDINRQSARWPPPGTANERTDDSIRTFQAAAAAADTKPPFSYIMASDAQLYWFNGEWAEMGQKSIPSSCSPSDSCARCTGNHGRSTNLRLKRAWEGLMSGVNATNESLPILNTLVMNGELC